MQSNHSEPARKGGKTPEANNGNNNYNNEMSSGAITESSGDNGAAELRDLKKKHSQVSSTERRRPML